MVAEEEEDEMARDRTRWNADMAAVRRAQSSMRHGTKKIKWNFVCI
jgi:hypothetical protein